MQMFTLSKEFRFEAAHRLVDYQGKCANLHGHSWKGFVVVECVRLDEKGFGVDYADLKQIITPIVKDLDHALLANGRDEELIRLCEQNGWKVCRFTDNPTSEVVAKFLFDSWRALVNDESHGIRLKKVIIEETCTSRCEYTD